MRCFFGVPLPASIRKKIAPVAKEILSNSANAKVVSEENLHITLRFLGDVEPAEILSSFTGFTLEPFRVKLSDIGAFPNKRNPRVVWLGVSSGSEKLIELHNRITSLLHLGSERFHPHVTLARLRSRIEQFPETIPELEPFEVSKFTLFSSTLTPSGPIYQNISSIPS